MKTRDKIVSRLAELNKKISDGVRGNPAIVEGDEVVINIKYYTNDQIKELVEIISEWGFKIEQAEIDKLLETKGMVETMLAKSFEEEE